MVGGGTAGQCTQASGILAQFEVLDIVANGNSPTLDITSETYWLDDSVSMNLSMSFQIYSTVTTERRLSDV
jgi:hypothetical protein